MKLPKPFLKKFTYLSLIIVIFLGLFLVNINEARAELTARGIAMAIIKVIFKMLLSLVQFLTGIFSQLFTAILNFGVKDMDVVYSGWTITRDIVNMFFILGLIAIAFATILKIETYGMKALLPKIIIIALLINFSYLACGIIIDAAQIATNFFVSGIQKGDTMGLVLLEVMGPAKTFATASPTEIEELEDISDDPDLGKDIRLIISLGFALIMVGLVGIILLIGAILLAIRVAALWLLTILAPFAWFLGIFPKFKGMADKWWNNFLKYAFFAPIFVFFIYLAIRLQEEFVKAEFLADAFEGAEQIAPFFSALFHNLFSYIVIIIILYAAPMVAMQMGIHGASAVIGTAKGAFKGTAKAALRTGERMMVKPPEWTKKIPLLGAVPRALEKYGKFISPTAWKEALRLREERMKRRAMMPAAGDVFDVLNRVMSAGKDKTFRGQAARQALMLETMKEMAVKGGEADFLISEAESGAKAKVPEKTAAAMTMLAMQKDLGDAFMQKSDYGKYAYVDWLEEDAKKKYGAQWKEKLEAEVIEKHGDLYPDLKGKSWEEIRERDELHNVSNPYALKRAVFAILKDSGLSETDAGAYAAQISSNTFDQGEHSAYRWSMFKKGKFRMATDDEHKDITLEKVGSIAPRYTFQHGTARDFLDLAQDGTPIDLHDQGLERLKSMSIKQVDDITGRFREWRNELRTRLSQPHILKKIREYGKKFGGKHEKTFNYFADKLEGYIKEGLEEMPEAPFSTAQ